MGHPQMIRFVYGCFPPFLGAQERRGGEGMVHQSYSSLRSYGGSHSTRPLFSIGGMCPLQHSKPASPKSGMIPTKEMAKHGLLALLDSTMSRLQLKLLPSLAWSPEGWLRRIPPTSHFRAACHQRRRLAQNLAPNPKSSNPGAAQGQCPPSRSPYTYTRLFSFAGNRSTRLVASSLWSSLSTRRSFGRM